jgi:hypothetical protein
LALLSSGHKSHEVLLLLLLLCLVLLLVCYLSVLQEPSSIEKVAEIDEHIGCAMSGLTADAKTLIDHARADTQVGSWTLSVQQQLDML